MTNGIGGFACGTAAGGNTRRYHGFLIASLQPPVARTLFVAKVDLSVRYLGTVYDLSANEFLGAIAAPGCAHLESFSVSGGVPTWHFAFADALIEQRIFMAQGANCSYLALRLLRGSAATEITLKPYVTYRDYHSHSRGARPFTLEATAAACAVRAFDGALPIRLCLSAGEFAAKSDWYWNFYHREEADRGLDALEDLWMPGIFNGDLEPGDALFFSAAAAAVGDGALEPVAPALEVLAGIEARGKRLQARLPRNAPPWIVELAYASDQFVVTRGMPPAGHSLIAGYPWFADWGRDTMIALPGLLTILGRYEVAADIFRTYVRYVDRGMLPNRFPDGGEPPEYNTADATLWMFVALDDYLAAKRDPELAAELYPALIAIIRAHVAGTRFHIGVDADDGLLRAGEPGMQLTWMDAKHDGQVFTPRIGKPVEINALWLNALQIMARLAARSGDLAAKRECEQLFSRAKRGFSRFWNAERECLYDVIDVDGGSGSDASLRPNALIAVSLPYCALTQEQLQAVVARCARDLLTSYGVRSLNAGDPAYVPHYRGSPHSRDAAYHQGTAWSWLLGPFAWAHYRAYGDARLARSFLEPIAQHMREACVGSISEIFDGDPPHAPRGCFAQAWSVAEILRTWVRLDRIIARS